MICTTFKNSGSAMRSYLFDEKNLNATKMNILTGNSTNSFPFQTQIPLPNAFILFIIIETRRVVTQIKQVFIFYEKTFVFGFSHIVYSFDVLYSI